jgi:hypothetical protein
VAGGDVNHKTTPPPGPYIQTHKLNLIAIRVARWYIFIPKIPNWVYFGGPCMN